ncbi:MAG: ABC transporter permease, partial [bacterium]|nr:ABC transporter permease [bacterium]
TALGFLIAWNMESSQGFHAVMNLVLFPLWMVSGALFPMEEAHGWMQWLMRVNPLTYATMAIHRLLGAGLAESAPPMAFCLTVVAVCGLVLWIASTIAARRRGVRSTA